MSQKIIYEPHPVSPERKAELRKQGLKIIDAIFKPADEAEATELAGKRPSEGLKVEELKAALEAKGIEIPEGALKAELQLLLDAAPQTS